jgi:DNA-binding NtrC family response regulator
MKRRILIADDDESLRRVMQMELDELGYHVTTAVDGDSALRLLAETMPALIISDLRMPGLSGLDLLRKIRADHPQITVIIVTAYGTVQNAVEAMKAGRLRLHHQTDRSRSTGAGSPSRHGASHAARRGPQSARGARREIRFR